MPKSRNAKVHRGKVAKGIDEVGLTRESVAQSGRGAKKTETMPRTLAKFSKKPADPNKFPQ